MAEQVYYFGCWEEPGHHFWASSGRLVSNREQALLPRSHHLDGTELFLPSPEREGQGALTYLPALDLTVLAWWGGNPWDSRGAVNQAVMVRGNHDADSVWQVFCAEFPVLSAQLKRPSLINEEVPHG